MRLWLFILFIMIGTTPTLLAKQVFTAPITLNGQSETRIISPVQWPTTPSGNTLYMNYVDTDMLHQRLNEYQGIYFLGQIAHGVLFYQLKL